MVSHQHHLEESHKHDVGQKEPACLRFKVARDERVACLERVSLVVASKKRHHPLAYVQLSNGLFRIAALVGGDLGTIRSPTP